MTRSGRRRIDAYPGRVLGVVKVLRSPTAHQRLWASALLGGVVGSALALLAPWEVAVLGGWAVAVAVFVAWVWLSVGRWDAAQTRKFATREDNSRASAQFILVSASVASLVGVGFDLAKATQLSQPERGLFTGVGLVAVVLSWVLVHTVYALRYAHEYYTEPVGGIDFKNDAPPDYLDFAYVAFTVGMTFQVSDTDVQARVVRRTVLHHALLAFLFGAVILAATINVVASLFR
jgi:uncharacterized membrane protein